MSREIIYAVTAHGASMRGVGREAMWKRLSVLSAAPFVCCGMRCAAEMLTSEYWDGLMNEVLVKAEVVRLKIKIFELTGA